MAKLPNRQLVDACIGGNQEAWRFLLERHRPLIVSVAARYGVSAAERGDVFQEVSLALYRNLSRMRDPDALPGWLRRSAARASLRWRARNAVFLRAGTVNENAAPPTPPPGEGAVEARWLCRHVAALPPRCKAIIEQLFFEEPATPYAGLARSLGVAVGSIGLFRSRCLDRLRAALTEPGTPGVR